ncbi:hypothetical protein A6E05_10235 [Aliivibrio sp. 1S165]|uniref:flippase n=1 Tax=unclassified Aliivibrio TaxID=2645654 RepID=UPI00080E6CE3|nr:MULTISPECIES: flippase [unclassified Aliivibrio]OCH11941.1 hypothetical protein A6E05_10235 [Aliivibrio sp. 1S165]OCH35867.1 hypothetical protein A6E06_10965 [Aliivibrio sp. 1S175]
MIYSILDKLTFAIFAFVSNIMIAKSLSINEYGLFIYIQTILYMIVQCSGLGIKNIYIKDYINNDRRDLIRISTLMLKLCAFSFFLLISFLFYIIDRNVTSLYIIILIIPCFFYSLDQYEWCNEISGDFKKIFYIKLSVFIFFLFLRVLFVFYYSDLFIFLLFYSLELPCCYLIQYISSDERRGNILSSDKDEVLKRSKETLRQSWPIFIALIIASIYNRIDQFMLANLIDNKELAIYGLSVKFTEPFNIFAMGVVSYIYPKLIKMKNNNEKLFLYYSSKWFYFVLLFGLFISIVLYSLSDYIFILFDDKFKDSIPVFNILSLTIPIMFVGIYMSNNLVVYNLQKLILKRSVIGVVMNVVLNFLLIPTYGAEGAAIATLITLFFINILYYLLSNSTREITHNLMFYFIRKHKCQKVK